MESKSISLSKEESLILYKKILKCIKKSKKGFFRFKKLRGSHGFCAWEDGIVLDYRRDLVSTMIHECLHYLEQDWSEAKILYAEKRIINSINKKQIITLIKNFINKVK
jgi:hypothetical protein